MTRFAKIGTVVFAGISAIVVLDQVDAPAGVISGVGAFTIVLAAVVGRKSTSSGSAARSEGLIDEK